MRIRILCDRLSAPGEFYDDDLRYYYQLGRVMDVDEHVAVGLIAQGVARSAEPYNDEEEE